MHTANMISSASQNGLVNFPALTKAFFEINADTAAHPTGKIPEKI